MRVIARLLFVLALSYSSKYFERFQTMKHMRDFISAGAAAGIASAFGAPVGGLLFSMEEVSSFWNQSLSWQIFFCAMMSSLTTEVLLSSFEAFTWHGKIGAFIDEQSILLHVRDNSRGRLWWCGWVASC